MTSHVSSTIYINDTSTIDAMISSITVYSSAHDCVVSHVTNEGYKELKVVFLINVKKRYIEILK